MLDKLLHSQELNFERSLLLEGVVGGFLVNLFAEFGCEGDALVFDLAEVGEDAA